MVEATGSQLANISSKISPRLSTAIPISATGAESSRRACGCDAGRRQNQVHIENPRSFLARRSQGLRPQRRGSQNHRGGGQLIERSGDAAAATRGRVPRGPQCSKRSGQATCRSLRLSARRTRRAKGCGGRGRRQDRCSRAKPRERGAVNAAAYALQPSSARRSNVRRRNRGRRRRSAFARRNCWVGARREPQGAAGEIAGTALVRQ